MTPQSPVSSGAGSGPSDVGEVPLAPFFATKESDLLAGKAFKDPTVETGPSLPIVTTIDATGVALTKPMTIMDIREATGLHSRDVLALDAPEPTPGLLVRRDCFIVILSHVRAIVFHNRVLLFDAQDPEVVRFQHQLRSVLESDKTSVSTFEMIVLEQALASVCGKMDRRLKFCNPVVSKLLNDLNRASVPDPSLLQLMLPLQQSIGAFETSANDLIRALASILDDDEGMSRLCLSIRRDMHLDTSIAPQHAYMARLNAAQDEIEMMIQTYFRRIGGVRRRLESLAHRMHTSQTMMNINMNNFRAHLMHVNLRLATVNAALAASTAITGMFGMNLMSGMEHAVDAFWIVGGLSLGAASLFYLGFSKYSMHPTASHASLIAMSGLTTQIDSIAHTMAMFEAGGMKLTKQQFEQLHSAEGGLNLSKQQLDLLFAAFDSDGDGALELEEYLAVLEQQEGEAIK